VKVNKGMRFYTSLALGLLAALCAGACSSDEGGAEAPPAYSGPEQSNNPNNPAPTAGTGGTGSSDVSGAAGTTPVGSSGDQSITNMQPSAQGGAGGTVVETGAGGTVAETGAGGSATETGAGGTASDTPPAGQTRVFLLFGQSNMWGVPNPTQEDMTINPRVEVLTISACGNRGANQWVPAQPPLHGCVGQIGTGTNGPGLGPGDYFAKTVADAFPQDTILLVPAAVPGVSIDTFQPGQQNYNNLVTRARMAQQRGTISGMIFHQGETDNNQDTWPQRVKTVVDRLRSDLGTGEVPFIAGELLIGGCCTAHNTLINQLPSMISNTFVARANGFTPLPNDGFGNLHFDLPSQREFGRRYGELMVDALTP
jgi:hypothetical protein